MCIQTGVRVRKRLSWVLTSVTLTFDLLPWPFAWTSLLSLVITADNVVMMRWQGHFEKGVTDGLTDGQTDGQTNGGTDRSVLRAAWSQLNLNLPSEFIIMHNERITRSAVRKNPSPWISWSFHWVNRHPNVLSLYYCDKMITVWLCTNDNNPCRNIIAMKYSVA